MYREGAPPPPLLRVAAGGLLGGNFVSGWLVVTTTSVAFTAVHGLGWEMPIGWVGRIQPCAIASASINGVRFEDMRGPAYELLVAEPATVTEQVNQVLVESPYR